MLHTSKYQQWGFLSFVILSCTVPLIIYGLKPNLHDAWIHRLWCEEVTSVLYPFQGYPRWLLGMNGGLGSPAMFFYPALPYVIPAISQILFEKAGLNIASSLGIGAISALFIAGFGMRQLLLTIVSPIPALISAALYVASPYCLGIDLYSRGAYAELWSFAWMPLVLLGVTTLRNGNRWGIIILSASYAALICSHLPTTLVFSFVPIMFSISLTKAATNASSRCARLRPLILTVTGMSLGIGMSLFYLLPAMTMQEHVSIDALTTPEILKYSNQFLFGSFLWNKIRSGDGFAQHLHLAFLILLFAGIWGYAVGRKSPSAANRTITKCLFLVFLLSVFMIIPLSQHVWVALPSLQVIQFPWRILTVLTVASVILVAMGLDSLYTVQRHWYAWCCFFIGNVMIWILALNVFPIGTFIEQAKKKGHDWNPLRLDVPEYRPKWATRDVDIVARQLRVDRQLLASLPFQSRSMAFVNSRDSQDFQFVGVRAPKGFGTFSIETWMPRQIRIRYAIQAPASCIVSQLFFPGWTARKDDGHLLTVSPSHLDGLVEVDLPAGAGIINLTLEPLRPEIWGIRASILFAIIWLAMVGIMMTDRLRVYARSLAT